MMADFKRLIGFLANVYADNKTAGFGIPKELVDEIGAKHGDDMALWVCHCESMPKYDHDCPALESNPHKISVRDWTPGYLKTTVPTAKFPRIAMKKGQKRWIYLALWGATVTMDDYMPPPRSAVASLPSPMSRIEAVIENLESRNFELEFDIHKKDQIISELKEEGSSLRNTIKEMQGLEEECEILKKILSQINSMSSGV